VLNQRRRAHQPRRADFAAVSAPNRTYGWQFAAMPRGGGGTRGTSVAFSLARRRGSRGKRDRNVSHTVRASVKDAPEETVMEFIARLKALARNDEGQDLLEYALLVALIALVCVTAITLAGTNVNTIFGNIASALTT